MSLKTPILTYDIHLATSQDGKKTTLILLAKQGYAATIPSQLEAIVAELQPRKLLTWTQHQVAQRDPRTVTLSGKNGDQVYILHPVDFFPGSESAKALARVNPPINDEGDLNVVVRQGAENAVSRHYPDAVINMENGQVVVVSDTALPSRDPQNTSSGRIASGPRQAPRRSRHGRNSHKVWFNGFMA